MGVFTGLVVSGVIALSPWLDLHRVQAAVSVGGATELRQAPAAQAAEIFRLSPGAPVRVRERYGEWLRVETGEGRTGWVEAANLAPLPPIGTTS